MKTSESQRVDKGCIGNEWVKGSAKMSQVSFSLQRAKSHFSSAGLLLEMSLKNVQEYFDLVFIDLQICCVFLGTGLMFVKSSVKSGL